MTKLPLSEYIFSVLVLVSVGTNLTHRHTRDCIVSSPGSRKVGQRMVRQFQLANNAKLCTFILGGTHIKDQCTITL
jgi:hypothetical protein